MRSVATAEMRVLRAVGGFRVLGRKHEEDIGQELGMTHIRLTIKSIDHGFE
jgi:hypothetical protein